MNSELYDLVDIGFSHMTKGKSAVCDNPDFKVTFDLFGESYTLYWIHNKTHKFTGTDIFKTILQWLKDNNLENDIRGLGIRGDYHKLDNGEQASGYYALMRWGFIPENLKDINLLLDTHYKL